MLPSQTSRGSGLSRSNLSRKKSLNIRPFAFGALAVAVVCGAVWGISKIGGKKDAGPQSANAATKVPPSAIAGIKQTGAEQAPPVPAPAPAPVAVAPAPADPPPLELRQGRPRPDAIAVRSLTGVNPPAQTPTPVVGGSNPQAPKPTAPVSAPIIDPVKTTPPTGQAPQSPPQSAPTISDSNPSITPGLATDLESMISSGFQALGAGDAVGARATLSRALADNRLPEPDKVSLRDELTKLNEDLVFSSKITPGDPYVLSYSVQSGDNLVKINQKNALGPDWRLIGRINKMGDAHRLSLGQRLKLIKGPFHCVVTKSAFRLDVWMGPTDNADQWVYVRSFKVGLGENGSTPPGNYIVKKGSKLVNPPWVNPRTGEKFDANDPKNPIGKFWVGLEGVGNASTNTGYGIHGTIDPDSIGQQKSMGCVRMGADDIALVFELMGEQVSTVKIQP
jgi:hypothetical protein